MPTPRLATPGFVLLSKHRAFIMLGSYLAYLLNSTFGLDPILSSLIMLPAFFLLGALVYQIYYVAFEKRGQEALRGLAFFFGLLFITEVVLILVFGVDYRYVEAPYIGPPWHRTSWHCSSWPPTRSASSAWPSASRSPRRHWQGPS